MALPTNLTDKLNTPVDTVIIGQITTVNDWGYGLSTEKLILQGSVTAVSLHNTEADAKNNLNGTAVDVNTNLVTTVPGAGQFRIYYTPNEGKQGLVQANAAQNGKWLRIACKTYGDLWGSKKANTYGKQINDNTLSISSLMSRIEALEAGGGLEPNLIHWYKMDEASGNMVADYAGTAHGTATGTTIVDGLGGTSKARQFVNAGDKIDFGSTLIPLGAKTIMFRIKKTSSGALAYIISNQNNSTGHGFAILVNTNGTLQVRSFKGASGLYRFIFNSVANICDDVEHLVKFSWDGTTDTDGAKLYIDDMLVPDSQATADSLEETDSSSNCVVGLTIAGANPVYAILDEIKIYNAAV